jgi:hypothetical protein
VATIRRVAQPTTQALAGARAGGNRALDGGDPLPVPGQALRELIRQAEHPLAHGDRGQDVFDQVGGGVGHAPAQTRRAEPALLA